MMKSMLLLMLVAAVTVHANTYDGSWPRQVLGSMSYPWRTIGKLTDSIDSKAECTAALVGEDLILTNWHCITTLGTTDVALKQYYFYLGTRGDIHQSESFVAYPVQWGKNDNDDDWAILQLNSKAGLKYGYLGIDDGEQKIAGSVGNLASAPQTYEAALCQESKSPFAYLASAASQQSDPNWMSDPADPANASLCLAGYPADLGNFALALADHCSLLGMVNGQWITDCPTSNGNSGSPMFYRDGVNYFIVALYHAESHTGPDSLENVPFNNWTMNLATVAAHFSDHVAELRTSAPSHAVLSVTRIANVATTSDFTDDDIAVTPDQFFADLPAGSDCERDIVASLEKQGLLDAKLDWSPEIVAAIEAHPLFGHPSKPIQIPGQLRVQLIEKNGSNEIRLALINPYADENVTNDQVIATSGCSLDGNQISAYLAGVKP